MSNLVLYNGAIGVGNHALPFQHGPAIGLYDCETRSKLYKITVRCRADSLAIQPLGSTGPLGGWLVDISEPRHLGAGVLEWAYLFAYLPAPRWSGESTVYIAQQIVSGEILEFPISTTASVRYEYFHTLDPTSIPQLRAYRAIKIGEVIYIIGTPPADGAKLILSEDSQVRPWLGHIYARAAIYVAPATFTAS